MRKYYLGYNSTLDGGELWVKIAESPAYYKKHLIINEDLYRSLDKYLRWKFPKARTIKITVWGTKLNLKIT